MTRITKDSWPNFIKEIKERSMIKLILPGSIRSKKNSKQIIAVPSHKGKGNNKHFWTKMGWQFCYMQIQPSNAYKKWEKEARISVLENAPLEMEIMEGPIHIEAHIYYKGHRPDLSGAMESVGDCLEGIVWANDRQIESWDGSRLIHDLKNPRTEVFIYELSVV